MTLRQKQSAFARQAGRLIEYAYANDYELTLGDAYRSPEEAARLAAAGKGNTQIAAHAAVGNRLSGTTLIGLLDS